ncbi:hypothetical protein AB0F17_08725 [Nonomuraea sp. NPDC026600]|uniref:hypothetical protein n=1 Tax=Nonomuraea sp. NPDC026600 TaxID=3155363 RepID=UPI0034018A9F
MTVTADTEAIKIPKSLEDIFGGQMSCDIAGCKVIFGHPVDLDSEFTAPAREQLQRAAAAEHGWKQTVARLLICPDCAAGPLGRVVVEEPHWNAPPRVEPRPPVMTGDDVSTIAIPAIRVADLRNPAGRRPYETPKDSAA